MVNLALLFLQILLLALHADRAQQHQLVLISISSYTNTHKDF